MADAHDGGNPSKPWFPMYADQFLASPKVARMSAEERGVYITVLLRSWSGGGYEMDWLELADELDISVQRLNEIMEGRVGRCFEVGDDGRWRSPRLEQERAEAKRRSDRKRSAGRKGGIASAAAKQSSSTAPADGSTATDPSSTAEAPPKQKVAHTDRQTDRQTDTQTEDPSGPPPTPPGGSADKPRRSSKAKPSASEVQQMARAACVPEHAEKALLDWHGYRKDLGKPLVRQTWGTLVARAAEDPDRIVRQVAHTIAQGWQGLRDPEPPAQSSSGQGRTLLTAREQEAQRRKETAKDLKERIQQGGLRPSWLEVFERNQDPNSDTPRIVEAD